MPQSPLDGAQEAVQRGVQEGWVVFQVITQPLGYRQHPLPHRQARDDVQGEMRGGFHHAPGGAGRTDATPLAGIRDQEVIAAVGATGAGKAMGEYAALEVAAKFPLGDAGNTASSAVIVQCQPGGQMLLHGAVEQRALGSSPAIDGTPGHAARLARRFGTAFFRGAGRGSRHGCPVADRDVRRYAHTVLAAMVWQQGFAERGGDEPRLWGDEGGVGVRLMSDSSASVADVRTPCELAPH